MTIRWLAVGIAGMVCALGGAGAALGQQGPGTKKMAALLKKLADESDPAANIFLNSRRAEEIRKRLPEAKGLEETLRLHLMLGYELVAAGKAEEGIKEYLAVREALSRPNIRADKGSLLQIHEFLAIAYMRMGEQANCVMHHGVDSCLMPIQGKGVHTNQEGSRKAIEELSEALKIAPDDLGLRWLLNIAYMTLGEYPEKVPAGLLIPPKAFESEHALKRFYDVAPKLGLATLNLSGGVIADDFDGDGNLDIVKSGWGLRDQLQFFRNNGDGTFSERTEQAGLMGEWGGLDIFQTDYNNDGRLDLFVPRGAWLRGAGHLPCSLLRNNGDGTFEDVTEEAGLMGFRPTQAACWGDFDNDGWLDLFLAYESSTGETHPCALYHNNHDGTFTNVAAACGLDQIGFVKAAVWGDFNNDGRPDLYLSRLGQTNVLWRNDGAKRAGNGAAGSQPAFAWGFTDVTAQAGVGEPVSSFPCWFFDYDNDGWLDLMVGSFAGFEGSSHETVCADYLGLANRGCRPKLYHNNHDGTFKDVTKEMHVDHVLIAMGANFGDLDNDGWLDCYFGTGQPELTSLMPNRMYRNGEGKVFQDVTTVGGFGHLQKGHGIAFADFDNDGDQDIYEVMGGAFEGDVAYNTLYENPGFGNHWVTLKLEGVQTNRAAIGVRIRVIAETAKGERSIYRVVGSGGSFGASPLRQEIGLGDAKGIKAIEILWPTTGKTQVIRGVGMDRFWKIREGDVAASEMKLKTFKLGGATADKGKR